MNNHNIVLGFYGDDFTGSTDVLEALTLSGIRTVLFLEPPSVEFMNESFPDIQAFGIAGVSRALSPAQMEVELRPAFKALKDSGASICHYKICSTFDSSPEAGNIGKAIDLANEVFDLSETFIPMVAGVPRLKRYTVFGNHFASFNDVIYRLDKHPVMSKHPVTPINEAELSAHLSKQTDRECALINVVALSQDKQSLKEHIAAIKQTHDIILFDVLTEAHLETIGSIMAEEAENGPLFTVGSSGVEYALTAAWHKNGRVKKKEPEFTSAGQSEPMLAVSGSCSEITKGQIDYARNHGFTCINMLDDEFLDKQGDIIREKLTDQVQGLLSHGRSVLIYSALGPDDPIIETVRKRLMKSGYDSSETSLLLGAQLGKVTGDIISDRKITRLVVAGGDTSGYVLKELEIYALEVVMPVEPGSPLCKAYSANTDFDGLEICLKGGQVGGPDFFVKVKNGC